MVPIFLMNIKRGVTIGVTRSKQDQRNTKTYPIPLYLPYSLPH